MKSALIHTMKKSTDDILERCTVIKPDEDRYINHALIKKYGSPLHPLHMDECLLTFGQYEYKNPLLFPLSNGENTVQHVVLQEGFPPQVIKGGYAVSQVNGFAFLGELNKNLPVIIASDLAAFFKIAQTSYAVVLPIFPEVCKSLGFMVNNVNLSRMQQVVKQLSNAGYNTLIIPYRPEHYENFKIFDESPNVHLYCQYQDFLGCDLTEYDDIIEVEHFLKNAITSALSKPQVTEQLSQQIMPWDGGEFIVGKSGVFYEKEDAKGDLKRIFISTAINVLGRTRDTRNSSWGLLVQWWDYSGVEHCKSLPMETFQTDGAELRKMLSSYGLMISSDYRARNLFQAYLMSYPTNEYWLCVNQVGWYSSTFVLPHCQFGECEKGDKIIYQSQHAIDSRYEVKGSLEIWRTQVAQILESHSLLAFALCTAFTGQLLELLELQGRGFHFKGGSSKGKSTALNIACSVYGNPKQFYRTWRATGNALEHTASMHNDGFLVLDEIGEIANPRELGNIVYMLSNGVGKSRMNKQFAVQHIHQWKLIFLSSGERSMREIMQEQGQQVKLGQEIRLIDIDVDINEHGVFDDINFAETASAQATELNTRINQTYGVAAIAWLEYLTQNKEEISVASKRLHAEYSKLLIGNIQQGHIVRVAHTFALVAVAGELATQAHITGWKEGVAFNAVKKVFNQWLSNFEHKGNYEDVQIISSIKAFFEANESSRFETITPDTSQNERILNRVGYWKISNGEKVFYILTEQFKSEICKGYDYKKVSKVLKRYGLLDHDACKSVKTVRLPCRSSPVKVYAIKESIFSLDLDSL